MGSIDAVYRIINAVPETREIFWNTFTKCARDNSAALRYIVLLMAMYIHLGPFSRRAIEQLDQRIAEIDAANLVSAPATSRIAAALT